MTGVEPEMRALLLGAIPALRAFAFSLTRDIDRSDDLVQETLVRAWTKADSFRRGTNLTAWLFTILRNLFYSEQRSAAARSRMRTACGPRGSPSCPPRRPASNSTPSGSRWTACRPISGRP